MNLIKSEFLSCESSNPCKCVRNCEVIHRDYQDYLVDESRLKADKANCIFFPSDTSDVFEILKECFEKNLKVVVSGARTGIVGGAVAKNIDCIISLECMNRSLSFEENSIRVQGGITLDELNSYLDQNSPTLFFPVDPTETTATIGGNVATNASGARTYFYGPIRNWVNALTVVLANGSVLNLKRGQINADSRIFIFEMNNEKSSFIFPQFQHPKTKNTAGILLSENMDAVDLFIGSEGILGVITEIELRLLEKPLSRLYTVIWTQSEDDSLSLVESIRKSKNLNLLAIEYFDPMSILILKARREQDGQSSSVPKIDDDANAAIFLDLICESDNELCEISDELQMILHQQGLSLEDTWSGLEDRDLQKMKQLRHALPETINSIVAQRNLVNPEIVKLGTDLAVPDGSLREMMRIYREKVGASGLEYVIFGHIGNNHLHLNMLPKTSDELAKAKNLYRDLAVESVRLGGSISGEHGIGRLKRHLMKIQYPDEMLDAMRNLKDILDPKGILNPGVLLPD
jgi:D-lactate dehydrogenase (cytochrome)